MGRRDLRRLLAPRHLAVFGGQAAAECVRQCRRVGYTGRIWPVHPTRTSIEGIPSYPDIAALPAAPDAAFLAVRPEITVSLLGELAELGAGGAVCHAAGFGEHDADGARLQREFVAAAGEMPVIGPNCIGVLNYLDGVAMWPDQHGGAQVQDGVALITQSGNIAQNISMHRRSLPIAQLITVGNSAVIGVAELIESALDDPRITAIGLHLEDISDAAGLSRAACAAARRGIPIVVLKTGGSELGAAAALSHTGSLAGPDVLCDAFFERYGMARVRDPGELVETLKFLHVHGTLPGVRIASASCSGGEAALAADLAESGGAEMPPLPEESAQRLREVLGSRVSVRNPLDYNAYIWGRSEEQTECFTAFLGGGYDAHLLLLDIPRQDRCEPEQWETTVDALIAAHRAVPAVTCVVSSLPEGIPEPLGQRLLTEGIAPMQGLRAAVTAITAAGALRKAHESTGDVAPLQPGNPPPDEPQRQLDERSGKRALAEHGLSIPAGRVVDSPEAAGDAAAELGFPVVAKALSPTLAHKSEAGGVRLGLREREQVVGAVREMAQLSGTFLIERVVPDAVAELIVGVHQDRWFGQVLTIGTGGVLVEVLRDSVTLLTPVTEQRIETALRSLRLWPLLAGFRGAPAADVPAVVSAVAAIARFAAEQADRLLEMDVNPLLVLPAGRGAVAADALVRLGGTATEGAR